MSTSSRPPVMSSDARTGVELLARNAVLHNRLKYAISATLEKATRDEIARLHKIGLALETAARRRYGMPPMDP